MVIKKQTKIVVEFIAKRRVIYIRPSMLQEKNWKGKKKISRAEKARSAQEERSCLCQGIPFKKRCKKNRRSALQHQSQDNTNHVFSIFSRTNFEPKSLQDWKITPIQSDAIGVVLVSLLLTLNTFHTLL